MPSFSFDPEPVVTEVKEEQWQEPANMGLAIQAYNTLGAVGGWQLKQYEKYVRNHAQNWLEGKLIVPEDKYILMEKAAHEHDVPLRFLIGILRKESGRDHFPERAWNCGNPALECSLGMGQINTNVHKVSAEQAYDPEFAINWAAKRLRGMMTHFNIK